MLLLLLELEGHRGPHGLEAAARSRSAARRRRAADPQGGGRGRGAAAPHALVGHCPRGAGARGKPSVAGKAEQRARRGQVPAGLRRLRRRQQQQQPRDRPLRAAVPSPGRPALPPPRASSTIVPRPPCPPPAPSHWPRRRSACAATARPLAAQRAPEWPSLRGEGGGASA